MKFTMIFMNIIVPPAAYCQSRFLEASLPSLSSREESRHGLCSPDLETKNMTKQKGDNDIMIQKKCCQEFNLSRQASEKPPQESPLLALARSQ